MLKSGSGSELKPMRIRNTASVCYIFFGVYTTLASGLIPREQEWRERERERVRAAQMQEDQAREREQERRAYEVPTVPSFFVADRWIRTRI